MASKQATLKSLSSGLSAYEEFVSNLQAIPLILLHYASFIVEIFQFVALSFNPEQTPFVSSKPGCWLFFDSSYILSAILHFGQESCTKLWILLFLSLVVVSTL